MKNKILKISIILILLSFIFVNKNVFGASYDLSDYKNHIGSNSWLIAYDETNNIFYLFVAYGSGKNFIGGIKTIDDVNYLNYGIACSASSGSYWAQAQYNYTVYTFDSSTSMFTNPKLFTPGSSFLFDSSMLFIASNTDYYYWENGTPFFQATPVPSMVHIATGVVDKALEKVEMTQEITTTIVGLAKYLIPLLICLLGFWKAWQILSHSLHKA